MDLHGAAFDGRHDYVYCRHCAVGYPGGLALNSEEHNSRYG
ncbi:MAG: hypothetical protein BWY92_01981 [Firmicutes bacterium ADurb.BinA052]|nr:MAG: hypothetical protein BWY92_01981 [Firmicutes bacterium ADurb.BinA052]